ncbi:MAG: hypothetical protein JWP34_2784 [Massilia sp.]|jgi:hypothetical protein|nr:hypothetical protein [Massilia sp.]
MFTGSGPGSVDLRQTNAELKLQALAGTMRAAT